MTARADGVPLSQQQRWMKVAVDWYRAPASREVKCSGL